MQASTLTNNAGDRLGSTDELATSTEPTDTASDTSSTFTQQLSSSQSNTVMAKRQQQRNMLSLLKRRRSAAYDAPSSSVSSRYSVLFTVYHADLPLAFAVSS